jgi:pyruvate dehydrogenase E2 component (dihydrolipoamide acetyltransferase)
LRSYACAQFPNLNATLQSDNEVIRKFGQVNVGVAVTVPGGLMTVVVKDTLTRRPLRVRFRAEVKAMAARARDGKVKPEDVDGSTFSTSNLGMYDVEDFIAIINPPEAAILAISSAQAKCRWLRRRPGCARLAHESHHLGRPPRQ